MGLIIILKGYIFSLGLIEQQKKIQCIKESYSTGSFRELASDHHGLEERSSALKLIYPFLLKVARICFSPASLHFQKRNPMFAPLNILRY